MTYYDGNTERRDRLKALAAVLMVHATLAGLILSGLDVRTLRKSVEHLKTFDVPRPTLPLVEPPPPPPMPHSSSAPKEEAAPENLRSKPAPIVAPTPAIPLPVPAVVATADVRGPEGSDRTAGASSLPGAGTGAGGNGDGFGGGGTGGNGRGAGDGRGFTPAQKISKIPDSAYRQISAMGMRRGRVGLTVRVEPDGTAANCRIAGTSGNPAIDALMCQLTLRYVRFRPARDPAGRPVPQDITWTPDWSPR